MTKTITISMNENDFKDIDSYCVMHNLTRSKFFVQSTLEKVQQQHLADSLIFICGLLDKGQIDGKLDEEDSKILHDLVTYWGKVNTKGEK